MWSEVVEVLVKAQKASCAYVDMAYQGFGDGIAEDGHAVVSDASPMPGIDFLVASSFSKSFSLYGERVGALSVWCAPRRMKQTACPEPAEACDPHQLLEPADARRQAVVANWCWRRRPWRAMWESRARGRCVSASSRMRVRARRASSWHGRQRTMDTELHHTATRHVQLLGPQRRRRCIASADEFGIYGVDSGRICVAALNEQESSTRWSAAIVAKSPEAASRCAARIPKEGRLSCCISWYESQRAHAEPVRRVRERRRPSFTTTRCLLVLAYPARPARVGRSGTDAPARERVRKAPLQHPLHRDRRRRGRRGARAGRARESRSAACFASSDSPTTCAMLADA